MKYFCVRVVEINLVMNVKYFLRYILKVVDIWRIIFVFEFWLYFLFWVIERVDVLLKFICKY